MNPLSLLSIGEKLLDKVLPDPVAKATAMQKLAELEQSGDLAVIAGQNEINKIEAANPSLFVSGWRPAVGWVCVGALGYQLIFAPLIMGVAAAFKNHLVLAPLETELLTTLLIGMLGLGGMRTVEKLNGKASK